MTLEEITKLSEKIKSGEATPAEQIALLDELNDNIDGLRQDVATLKNAKDLAAIRASITADK